MVTTTAMMTKLDSSNAPLLSNAELKQLAQGIWKLPKDRRDAVVERFIFIRGTYERELERLRNQAAPIDDIEYIIARHFYQVGRGQNERLDRINAWLNKVKPIE